MSLISRTLSANQSPMLDSGTSYSPENHRLGWDSDLTSVERSVRDRVEKSSSVLKCGTEVTIRFQVPRDRSER